MNDCIGNIDDATAKRYARYAKPHLFFAQIVNNSKASRKTFSVPGLISTLIDRRAKALGYRSVSGYLLGLVLYDLWSRKPHALTLQVVNEDRQEMRDAVFSEIAQCFDQPEKPSSYFEHRLAELAGEIARKNAGDNSPRKE